MPIKRSQQIWHAAAELLFGAAALAFLTWICFWLELDIATIIPVYMIVVVLLSLRGRVVPAVTLSIIAAACLAYFFTPPILSFQINSPEDIVTVAVFAAASLVITGLVRRTRRLGEAAALKDRLQVIIDTIPAVVWSNSPDGSADFLNQRFRDYTGLSQEEGRGWAWMDALHPEDRAIEAWRTALAAGEPFEKEARLRRADGGYRWFLLRFAPLRDERGNIVEWYATSTDIDDLKRAEEVLRERARLLDLTHDTVFVRDMHDIITYWNRGAEELYGWKGEEAIGKLAHQLLQTRFPEQLVEITEVLLRTGRWEGELVHIKRNGTEAIVASRWSLQQDGQGRPAAILETNNDITERKRAEEELRRREATLHEAQMELAHANRVTTTGQLAASIAHEVAQPIAAAVTNANAALRWLGAQPPELGEVGQALGRIVNDGKRASDIISRIRALVRRGPPQKDQLDLNDTILEVVAVTRTELLRNGVALRTSLADGLPVIQGDRIQLQQVVLNLTLNALEAMSGSNEGPRELLISTKEEGTNGVLVAVHDSGPGLQPDSSERLFNPFYTTKPSGMGMGLSICRSIIEAHGGRVWATPNAPQGAIFQFTVPQQRESVS
jgi:two-component system, LuxR family, sensor kinase FixL